MLRSRSSIVCSLAVAALSILQSCGDDDAEIDGSPAVPASAAAESPTEAGIGPEPRVSTTTQGEPIKRMIVYEEAQGVSAADTSEGVRAAVQAINADGGVQGRQLELIECQTHNDPNAAADCGREAVAEGVAALVGTLSAHSGSFMPILQENQIPSIGNQPVTAEDFTSPVSFPLIGGAVNLAGHGVALSRAGARHIAIAHLDIPEAGGFQPLVDQGLDQDGLAVERSVPVPIGAPDMSSYVAATLQGEVDGVLVAMTAQDAINFAVAAKQADPGVLLSLSTTEVPTVVEALTGALGEQSDGIMRATAIPEALDTPEYAQFATDMRAAGFDDIGGDIRLNGYVAVKVFAHVAETLPDINAPAVLEALGSLSGFRTGLLPPIQFTTGGAGGFPRIFNPCIVITEIRDGALTTVGDGTFVDPLSGEACPAP